MVALIKDILWHLLSPHLDVSESRLRQRLAGNVRLPTDILKNAYVLQCIEREETWYLRDPLLTVFSAYIIYAKKLELLFWLRPKVHLMQDSVF